MGRWISERWNDGCIEGMKDEKKGGLKEVKIERESNEKLKGERKYKRKDAL